MAQSLSKVLIHFIFSTKNRIPFLNDDKIRTETYKYLATILKNHDSPSLIIGGIADHIHILCSLSRNHTIAEIIRELKRTSSKWIKTKGVDYQDFQWQTGYGAFSISPSHVDDASQYISNQAYHHSKATFKDEFRMFLKKYKIQYDERYVWD